MKIPQKFLPVLLLVIFGFFTHETQSGNNRCNAPGFKGMEESKHRAEGFLASTTYQPEETKIYIEYTSKGTLYYHSNFIPEKQSYSTKVTGSAIEHPDLTKLDFIFPHILQNNLEQHIINKILRDKVKILLDVSMFDNFGIPRINITDIKNVRVVDGHRRTSFDSNSEILTSPKPPPSLISKIRGCCFYGRPPHRTEEYSDALSKKPFEARGVKVVSMFIDGATDSAFRKSKLLMNARVKGDGKSLHNMADLRKVFAKAKGSTVLLLGHVEGQDFVIRTAANAEQFRAPIDYVRLTAKEEGVSLIDIGCETTRSIESQSLGFGVMTKYNSVDAVSSIELGLRSSKTLADFLENISSEGLKIVVDQNFVKDHVQVVHSSIYSKMKGAAKNGWIRVAQVTASLLGE
jgi:hypothetical protein